MFEGVGRRRDQSAGRFLDLGAHGLNGREHKCLFRNNGDGTFTDVAHVNAADRIEDGRGLSLFDYDRDGQVDILLRNYRQPAQLLRNVGPSGHWLDIKLVGTRSNRDAVGARITVTANGGRQLRQVSCGSAYLSGQTLVQHFGLGRAGAAEQVDVAWPSGAHTAWSGRFPAGHRLVIREGSAEPDWEPPLPEAVSKPVDSTDPRTQSTDKSFANSENQSVFCRLCSVLSPGCETASPVPR